MTRTKNPNRRASKHKEPITYSSRQVQVGSGRLLSEWKNEWQGASYFSSRIVQFVKSIIEDDNNLLLDELAEHAVDNHEGLARGYTQHEQSSSHA
ncbi:unnamed protein product [Linum trigynum]|uniref:Uncharacterized protein n=1 Tax=Linum trigynum TaxID=586398 RepID=A0AAV2DQ74_9ROSI